MVYHLLPYKMAMSSDCLQGPCRIEKSSEKTPLLSSRRKTFKKRLNSWYTLKWIIKSKGAVFILSWVALIQSFDPVVAISITGLRNTSLETIFVIYTCCSFSLYLFYPLIGLYADIKYGRRRVALSVATISLVCTVLVGIGFTLTHDHQISSIIYLTVFAVGLVIGNLAQTVFLIVMAMYGFEQLTGASSEQLSAYAHWYYWCRIFGWAITVPIVCAANFHYGVTLIYGLHIICLLFILVSCFFSKKLQIVETISQVNPLTQMARVLKYAKRNNYPQNRSALTYWEEKSPSRLDLGKAKYGGPFTEEEVEDVKTFFKLFPLVVCMILFTIIEDQLNPYAFFYEGQYTYGNCLVSSVYFINGASLLLTMFVYQLLKPLFDKCFRTMLRRIGFGIFLVLVTECIWLTIDTFGHFSNTESNETCIFNIDYNNINSSNFHWDKFHWDISHSWVVLPKVTMGISFAIALPTTLEFVFAQAPHSMKGLLIGIWFMVTGCAKMIGYNLHYPFKLLKDVTPNCSFYYYLTKIILIVMFLVCFIVLSLWYKRRQRELYFDSHLTVEDFYVRDFVRREEYEKDRKRRKMLGENMYRDVDSIDIHEYLNGLSRIHSKWT